MHNVQGNEAGFPYFTLLFLFVAEIFSLKLKLNNQIKSIQLNNTSTEIKKNKFDYADDSTLALKDVKSLEKQLKLLKTFVNMLDQKRIRK